MMMMMMMMMFDRYDAATEDRQIVWKKMIINFIERSILQIKINFFLQIFAVSYLKNSNFPRLAGPNLASLLVTITSMLLFQE